MKVVLDSNVVVAAFASRGLCESVFEICLSEHEIVSCVDLVDEIARGLREKIGLPAQVVAGIRTMLAEHSIMLDPVALASNGCRDPDDVKVLGLAAAARADCIVTGDRDLLILERWQGIAILSPRSFAELIRSG
ncbi:MAG TPA: putative toxin-antitoxin system toxin component, PIN family [Sedimentisphaerales bacterium]|nr:putative toxin-antitoxin system toxin component, PIN family [Sedimentisphaerales bacterium]